MREVENVMVNFPICLKVTLVNPSCNNRFICYFDGSNRFSGLTKGFLDSDVIFGAVGLGLRAEGYFHPNL